MTDFWTELGVTLSPLLRKLLPVVLGSASGEGCAALAVFATTVVQTARAVR